LGQDSPCIDAGRTVFFFDLPDWYQFPAYDLAGNPRIYGDQVDLGAYEWQGQVGIENLLAPPTLSMSNYPNPFNPSTTISYSVPMSGIVSLSIYNAKGQLVNTLVSEYKNKGNYQIVWHGKDKSGSTVASGLYFTRLASGGKSLTNKMLLMK
ncbi:MAG: FlgD immunoglobulin-like domain containing protein, partial [Candidatus Cloacimonetes bacterium]|nr:FlgD immunoglobulin-like domain containing protein [Candidatus Cloacimonadota bacterium]MDD3533145.1 FlgD immunoglobulin-like domain containing protein [Candidatus Cloacimonadota bacterium]